MSRAAATALLALCVLSGCGQKGPLYLPDHKPTPVAAPAPGTSPSATATSGTDPNSKKKGQDDTDSPQ
jgi:predicted small lipoprotein YifL